MPKHHATAPNDAQASLSTDVEIVWSHEAAAPLRMLVRERSNQADLAEAVGISRATLQRILNGTGNPGIDRLGALAKELLVPIDELLPKGANLAPAVVAVPVYDVQIAAGAGRLTPERLVPVFEWTFPREWAEANLPGARDLIVFRVSGDSQWPELSDGDLLAVDSRSKRVSDDLHVVRVGDTLKVKRMVRDGEIIRLLSRNELYPPEEINLRESEDNFEVIGRAVWASRLL